MRKFFINAGFASGYIFYLILGVIGLIIHLWTIFISFAFGGIISALIALVLPIVAELFWFFNSWKISGTFFNIYTTTISIYVVLWILTMGLIGFCASKIEDNNSLDVNYEE